MEKEIVTKAYLMDQIITVNLPTRAGMQQLYEASKALTQKPLCLAAAEKILATTSQGDNIFIITGFPVLPQNISETDGPPGAIVLAETLKKARLNPILITDSTCKNVLRGISQNTPVHEFPINEKSATAKAEELLTRYHPSILISIERPGWNTKRVYHTMGGISISDVVGKTDILFNYARERRIATIAVGDGGNELGCGAIVDAVRKYVPYGIKCKCPCGRGIAAATPADVLAVARVSNWSAYAVAACLSLMEELEYGHNWESELQLLDRVVEAGGIDSITKEAKPFVDGLSSQTNGLVADLLWRIAKPRA